MAELFGRTTGVSHGWGGSMHLYDVEKRLLGGYAIVGGQIPPATGAALAIAYRGPGGPDAEAVVCQLGDATTNIGAWHESLNLAAIWKLPIVFLIVNNHLGMGTQVERASGEPDLYKRGSAFRIPGVRVDGNDVVATRNAMAEALRLAREERQPSILEATSWRLRGHSVVDPATYRTKEEVQRLHDLDPLAAFRKQVARRRHARRRRRSRPSTPMSRLEVNECITVRRRLPPPEPGSAVRARVCDTSRQCAARIARRPASLPVARGDSCGCHHLSPGAERDACAPSCCATRTSS